jgi:photosystem II stability/assembly factor-like uncharacterized protein
MYRLRVVPAWIVPVRREFHLRRLPFLLVSPRTMRRHLLIVLSSFAAMLLPRIAGAQWTSTPVPILNPHLDLAGAIVYQHGLVWAGYDELWVSTDVGLTWTRRADRTALGQQFHSYVSAISFVDNDTGYVSTVGSASAGVLKTTDGGFTWRKLLNNQIQGMCINATGAVVLAGSKDGRLFRSNDRGETWSSMSIPGYTFFTDFQMHDAVTEALLGFLPTAILLTSTDEGSSWNTSSTIDGDSWSFASDRCTPSTIWAANEDVVAHNDGRSQIFESTDLGRTWGAATTGIPTLTGAITAGPHAVTAGLAYESGLLQSIDRGTTWQQIAGPHTTVDTRMLLSLDDTTFIVADSEGYIWRGNLGFTVNHAELSAASLFTMDSLGECDTSIVRSLLYLPPACTDVAYTTLSENHPGEYTMLHSPEAGFGTDSVVIRYNGKDSGEATGKVTVVLKDSTRLVADLYGFRTTPTTATALSANVEAHAIGEIIEIPLHLSASSPVRHASWIVRYDSMVFVYRGSFLDDGSRIDADPIVNSGHVLVSTDFSNRTELDVTSKLQAYPVSEDTAKYPVAFDSISWITSKNCLGSIASVASSDISLPGGCETPILSQFMRYGHAPGFSVQPNPAHGVITVNITHVKEHVVSIADLSGKVVLSSAFGSAGEHRLDIHTLPRGAYMLTVVSPSWRSSTIIVKW